MTMKDELNMAGNRIPFFMLVLTVFFRGSIFIFLNASILYHYIRGTSYSNFGELVAQGIFDSWKTILSTSTSLSTVSFLILISIIFGLALNPLQQIISGLFALIFEMPKFIKRKRDKLKLFSPFLYANEDYINVMEWLSNNRTAKIQWEWQQFYYHVWWTFTMNMIIFDIFTLLILRQNAIFNIKLSLISVTIVFLLGSLYHSWHMGNVHINLIKRMYKDKTWERISFKG